MSTHSNGWKLTVVLFDIDGTLLWSDGAGRRAIHAALTEVFGGTGPSGHRFDGKTDRQIVRELMTLAGHGRAAIDAGMDRVLTRYVSELHRALRDPEHPPQRLAGVPELLDALERRDDVVLGPTRSAMYGNLQPVVALVVAWLALGERPTLVQVLGAAAIMVGLLLTRT